MKVLVYPHDLNIGGSQINAIEISRAVADLGHEVSIYGPSGTLVQQIRDLGIEYIPAPKPGRRPSKKVVSELRHHVKSRRIDILHGYEWPPILECLLASFGSNTTVTGTVMSMAVAPFLPHSVPTVVGTPQIAHVERQLGRDLVAVIEPPVDLVHNNPGIGLNTARFRAEHGIREDEMLIVCVSRLAAEMKREGLLAATRVCGRLSKDFPLRLVIVGDGAARDEIAYLADSYRNDISAPVILIGELSDPRVAYAAADVVLGMGGSALRAMAFAKPVIVQGEQGFWRTLSRESVETFLWTGWYGVGEGVEKGEETLTEQLERLIKNPQLREDLGRFSHSIVESKFSLRAAAKRQVEFYEYAAGAHGGSRRGRDITLNSVRFARYKAVRRLQKMMGTAAADDFNARTVVGNSLAGEDRAPLDGGL
ncbi:glycosyltransferase family 4 protein [Ornithinicoccus hortensis]|uniref:D-inositol 3-phosphate glycosyltransferase n=1 Tax=Ornithinicoccus hortensis TaxID=82346 RepID=A0A542YLL9_9MICO|nr:glycosyltransferase family 4 protein [Ornithinicoccus hortensis]TQL48982.1 glycosyltransferase involved in cell wall biosynthesis [Ornithinicoccus hortensis]